MLSSALQATLMDLDPSKSIPYISKCCALDMEEAKLIYKEWRRGYVNDYKKGEVKKKTFSTKKRDLEKDLVLDMYYNKGYSLRKIGEELGVAHPTVKANLLRWGYKLKS